MRSSAGSEWTPSISIVIPIFNNGPSISELWQNLKGEISKFPGLDFEAILVDDGSTDDSWEAIQQLSGIPKIAVKLSKNFGQLGAMKAGYSVANGDSIISISADLQDPLYLISEMIIGREEGFQLVICERTSRDDSFWSKVTSKVAYYFLRRDNPLIPKGGFDVFLFSKKIRDQMLTLEGRFNFLQGDLLSFGYKYKSIPYHREQRKYGKSGYTFRKRFRNFQDALLDSNYTLIGFVTSIGFMASSVGFLLGILVFIGKVLGRIKIEGYTLVACSVLFIGGLQIMLTGILGQYIWRIYDSSRNRQPFVIDEMTESI